MYSFLINFSLIFCCFIATAQADGGIGAQAQSSNSSKYLSSDTERAAVARGHYSRARAMLLEALDEFEQGRKIARPDLFFNPETFRADIITRTEDIAKILNPQAAISIGGEQFKGSPELLTEPGAPKRERFVQKKQVVKTKKIAPALSIKKNVAPALSTNSPSTDAASTVSDSAAVSAAVSGDIDLKGVEPITPEPTTPEPVVKSEPTAEPIKLEPEASKPDTVSADVPKQEPKSEADDVEVRDRLHKLAQEISNQDSSGGEQKVGEQKAVGATK
jgi:hypothetical protein